MWEVLVAVAVAGCRVVVGVVVILRVERARVTAAVVVGLLLETEELLRLLLARERLRHAASKEDVGRVPRLAWASSSACRRRYGRMPASVDQKPRCIIHVTGIFARHAAVAPPMRQLCVEKSSLLRPRLAAAFLIQAATSRRVTKRPRWFVKA